jgi:hypothetical protein
MNHFVRSLCLGLLVASCGGKAAPAGGSTTAAPAASALPAGIHGCAFTVDGETYGPHRCDIAEGRIDKLSGMELFTGTFTESADTLTVTAKGTCSDMGTNCDGPFTLTLTHAGSSWTGPVSGAKPDWWLASATFSVTDAADYGGDTYGGAGYGGAPEGD